MKKTLWTLLALLLVVAFSCKEDEPDPTLDVDKTELTITNTGGNDSFTISSNTLWTLTSSAAWAVPSATSGNGNTTVTIEGGACTSTDARTAIITVSSATLPDKKINVTQFGEGKAILIKSVSYTGDSLLANGGTFKVIVSSNVTVKSSITAENDWVTENAPQGVAKTIIDKEFIFKAAANYDAGRTAKLRFFEEGNAALADSITVKQKAGVARKIEIIESDHPGGKLSSAGASFTITLSANVTVVAEVPALPEGWVTAQKINNTKFKFTIGSNTDYTEKPIMIAFKDSLSDYYSTPYSITQAAYEGTANEDSLALVALYNATNGASWNVLSGGGQSSPWILGNPMSTWLGVGINSNKRVTSIATSNFGLKGSIPAAFYNLAKMTSLRIVLESNLSGGLSADVKKLQALANLEMHSCPNLGGTIPVELGLLKSLGTILMYSDGLTGTIPKELGSLTSLATLKLHANKLSGSIPEELYEIKGLASLQLDGQEEDGQGNHGLTGTISEKIGQLSLTYLNLAGNKLTGSIPASLFSLSQLSSAHLHNNNLTGTLPDATHAILNNFNVTGNRLSGAIPENAKSSPKFIYWNLCPQQATYGLTNFGMNGTCYVAPPAPANPTNFVATGGVGKISLTWTPSVTPDVTNVIIERSAKSSPWVITATFPLPADATSYDDTTATVGLFTYYKIYVTTPGGNSTPAAPKYAKAL